MTGAEFFLLAWLPLLVILACYDLIRSRAGGLIERAHVEPQLSVDGHMP